MGKHWYMEFVTGDWLTAPDVCLLKPATRGIWMDALCRMFQLDQSGELSGTVPQLALLCRCSEAEMWDALSDLDKHKSADVSVRGKRGGMLHFVTCNANVTAVVTVVNRRMKREFNARKSSAERVMRHRSRIRNGECNGNVTGDVTPPLIVNLNPTPLRGGGGKESRMEKLDRLLAEKRKAPP